ncbi:hypothetical protein [Streptomyces sp. NPDC096012]|uniref:hypothetical protein n=1 Tax=Streptomyces sp. NPDC096012 TaxID=3155684 RepID=UPI00336A7349
MRDAARRAGAVGATLVLAFLGHGMSPRGRSDLYPMGVDAEPDVLSTAVNVGHLGGTSRRLRLVVSLHATVADDWPESLGLWLLDGGTVCERAEFPGAPTQAGVETKLGESVAWGRKHARLRNAPLRHVDVAGSHLAAAALEA